MDVLERIRDAWMGKRDPWLRWLAAAAFAFGMGHGLLADIDHIGWGDWDGFTVQSLVARRSWVDYGQAPFWNPYHCGGQAITENMQTRAWSPTILLVLPFGVQLGNRLWMLLALALGFEGTRRLARTLGAGPWGALFAAVAVAGNGAITTRMASGHFGDVPYLFLPWWWLAMRDAMQRPWRGLLVGGLWGALCYVEAGIYELVYGAMVAAPVACVLAWRQRSWRAIVTVAGVAVTTFMIASPIAVPSTLFKLARLDRPPITEIVPIEHLWDVFFSANLDWRRLVFPEQHWRWHEYATYVGPLFAAGMVVAAVWGRRDAAPGLILGVFFVVFGLGDFAVWSPWSLSHLLPVFDSMRASGRAFIPAVMCFAFSVALTLDRTRLAPLLAIGLGVQLAAVSPGALQGAFAFPLPEEAHDTPFVQSAEIRHYKLLFMENHSRMTEDVLRNRGALACYDPVLPAVHARPLPPELGEVMLLRSGGEAKITRWSPQELHVALAGLSEPGYLLVNQNYHPGWHAGDGRPLSDRFGVIAVPVTPDDARIVLRFFPPLFPWFAAVSVLTVFTLVLAHLRQQRRARVGG